MVKIMGVIGRSLVALGLIGGLQSVASAATISSITSTGTGFALLGSSFVTDPAGKTELTNFATLNLQANDLASPFNVRFNLSRDADSGTSVRTYEVTVNVTNAVGREIPGFDVENGNQAGAGFSGALSLVTDAGAFTFEDINPGGYNLANGYRFGGLNGGGHALSNGGTWTVKFTYELVNGGANPAAPRFASLNFTANPEPTTLLLGSLAMIPAAVVARRRRKAASELIEA